MHLFATAPTGDGAFSAFRLHAPYKPAQVAIQNVASEATYASPTR
jgi:hypothetical protein